MPNQANGLYEFGSFRLDAAKRLLSRGSESVTLAPKTFDLLHLLVGSQGRVLNKRELMNALWPDVFVEEASLSYQIATLRKALGDEGEALIETVPRHGYRFAATVTKIAGDGAQSDDSETTPPAKRSRERLAWAAICTALAVGLALALWIRSRSEQPLVRLTAPAPESTTLAQRGAAVISPDGQRLALVAQPEGGKPVLWIRPLESLAAQPLAGTEGARLPFCSPDSRALGFFADGKLKTIDVTPGLKVSDRPKIVCDSPDAFGGAWSRQGVILFCPFWREPVYRVPASGGVPTAATKLDRTTGGVQHRMPQFLPDGRNFLFHVQSPRPEVRGVWLGSLDSPDVRRLVESDVGGLYASGHLLFLRDGTLFAQPLRAGRWQLEGDPVPLAAQVTSMRLGGVGEFSASETGLLTYRTAEARVSTLVWFDRQGKQLESVASASTYRSAALSPDGSKIAVEIIGPGFSPGDIWLIEPRRNVSSRVTTEESWAVSPIWSPDGARIAFGRGRGGVWSLRQVLPGGAEEELFQTGGPAQSKWPTDWSPDGRFILYFQLNAKSKNDLWVLPMTGERKPFPVLASSFDAYGGQFSPDGRWIAYVSDESGAPQVYVQAFTRHASSAPPGRRWQISSNGGLEVRWRRDGKELYYLAQDDRIMVVPVKTGPSFEAGAASPLFAAKAREFAVAADGQRFLLTLRAEHGPPAPVTIVVNWTAGLKR